MKIRIENENAKINRVRIVHKAMHLNFELQFSGLTPFTVEGELERENRCTIEIKDLKELEALILMLEAAKEKMECTLGMWKNVR